MHNTKRLENFELARNRQVAEDVLKNNAVRARAANPRAGLEANPDRAEQSPKISDGGDEYINPKVPVKYQRMTRVSKNLMAYIPKILQTCPCL